MATENKIESSIQKRSRACEEYKDYYSEYKGPIGGDYRFKWVCDTYFKRTHDNNEKILDLGCGEGTLVKMLAEMDYDSYGVDASESGIKQGENNSKGRLFLSDIETEGIPFPDKFFDCICCFETFEHFFNPHRALEEVKRTLKQGGRFLVSIPNPMIGHPFIYPGLFTRRYFKDFLMINGMKITSVRGWGQAPQLYIVPDKPIQLFHFLRRCLHSIYSRYTPISFAWLWVFDTVMQQTNGDIYKKVARETRPVCTK